MVGVQREETNRRRRQTGAVLVVGHYVHFVHRVRSELIDLDFGIRPERLVNFKTYRITVNRSVQQTLSETTEDKLYFVIYHILYNIFLSYTIYIIT